MPELEKLSDSTLPDSEIHPIDIRKALAQRLESLRLAGLTHLPAGTGKYEFEMSEPNDLASDSAQANSSATGSSSAQVVREAAVPVQAPAAAEETPISSSESVEESSPAGVFPKTARPVPTTEVNLEPYGTNLAEDQRAGALQVLQDEIAACTRCEELASKRTQTVFGVGNPSARLVFVGEAPGFHEDRKGEPFVGDAGEKLDKILKACKLSRETVFILNSVKCRPPGNRNPSQDELANCWEYAERQLEILQPEYIVCLGSVAAKALLKTTQSLGRLRKQFHTYRGSRVLVTYHPAYLLRTPSANRHVWEDMKMLMKEMGIDWTK